MGLLDKAKDAINDHKDDLKDAAHDHEDQVNGAIDKGGDFLKDKAKDL